MKAIEILKPFNPCQEAIEWLDDKTIQEAWDTCHRGDWLLWAYAHVHPEDVRGRVAAAAECAATVINLLTDPRSIAAIEAARAFGRGEIDEIDLKNASLAAREATWAAARAATWAAWAAARAAARAARAAEAADWAARAAEAAASAAYWAAAYAADATRNKSLFEMANICRELLTL